MFGMGAGEILILLIVGIVVVGPQKLPGMMRTAGQWVSRLRRMSTDLRAQSGIDRIIRDEGLEKELRELRSLSRAGVLDSLMQASAATRAPLARPVRQPIGGPALGAASLGAGTNAPEKPASLPAAIAPVGGASTNGATESSELTAAASSTDPAAAEVAQGSTTVSGSESAAARMLVRPAAGTVARHEVRDPYASFREREYPTAGCDHYDALPDDLDEPEQPDEPNEPEAQLTPADPSANIGTDPSGAAGTEPARTEV